MTTSDDDMELVHGSGNVFRDLGRPNPEARQLKALLASQVQRVMDERRLTTRQAQAETGIDHGDFTRVRRANLERFSVERLIAMLEGLGQEVEVTVKVHPLRGASATPAKSSPRSLENRTGELNYHGVRPQNAARSRTMADEFFIERREDGQYKVLKPDAERASAAAPTQAEAIARAKQLNPNATVHIERVRQVGPGRDKWRS